MFLITWKLHGKSYSWMNQFENKYVLGYFRFLSAWKMKKNMILKSIDLIAIRMGGQD